ncbi:MAG: Hsp20/alpha crystallin family protein [Saprospiraceae bacterium]|jgi:HSP20 family protein|nr:Hsp20/alpha crystallin family protein [Saprospiraceae bacterium]MBP9198277.1 Hsp20/alpha crystallin family protein [Saprospiraceae bacterium]
MTNIVFKPLCKHPSNDFNRVLGGLFNSPLHSLMDEKKTVTSPVYANVKETEQEYSISLAVPGYEKSEIEIFLDKSKLTIKGKKATNGEVKFSTREFDFSNFERTFYLPENVQTEKIEARSENGILNIHIPKAEVKTAINITVK